MLWKLSKMEQRCDAVLGVIRDGYPAQILPPDRHEDAVRLLRHALKRRRHRVTFRLITEL
jgi:hypothetical protein